MQGENYNRNGVLAVCEQKLEETAKKKSLFEEEQKQKEVQSQQQLKEEAVSEIGNVQRIVLLRHTGLALVEHLHGQTHQFLSCHALVLLQFFCSAKLPKNIIP